MSLVTNEQVLELQKKHGIAPHEHINGLMSCAECAFLVATGKTIKQLSYQMGLPIWQELFGNCKHTPKAVPIEECKECVKEFGYE